MLKAFQILFHFIPEINDVFRVVRTLQKAVMELSVVHNTEGDNIGKRLSRRYSRIWNSRRVRVEQIRVVFKYLLPRDTRTTDD